MEKMKKLKNGSFWEVLMKKSKTVKDECILVPRKDLHKLARDIRICKRDIGYKVHGEPFNAILNSLFRFDQMATAIEKLLEEK